MLPSTMKTEASSLGTTAGPSTLHPQSRVLFSDESSRVEEEGGGVEGSGSGRPPKRTIGMTMTGLSRRKEIKRKRREMAGKMASFVFFDIESTGLFRGDEFRDHSKLDDPAKVAEELYRYTVYTQESSRPHMTECSFVVVSRGAFEDGIERMRRNEEGLERNPGLMLQTPIVSNITTRQVRPDLREDEWRQYENIRRPETSRLTRKVLKEKAPFKEEWPAFYHALRTAPKPCCIVAHNGLKFDLRVLHAELQRGGELRDGWLPDEVFFIDSLLAFRSIDREDTRHISSLVNGTDWNAIAAIVSTPPRTGLATVSRGERIPVIEEEGEDEEVVEETPPEAPAPLAPSLLQLQPRDEGMRTPERRPRCPGTASGPARLMSSRALFPEVVRDFLHPLNYIRSEEWTIAKKKRIDQRVFKKEAGRFKYREEEAMDPKKRSFGQENMYMQIFSDTYNAHSAQDDCEALMQICLAYGSSFLEYADTMAADIIY